MHSVAPQQTVTFSSGSQGMPLKRRTFSAIACRSGGAPQVMAYWLKPSWIALAAASLSCLRGFEVGHALAEVDRPVAVGQRVISRMTDSVKYWTRAASMEEAPEDRGMIVNLIEARQVLPNLLRGVCKYTCVPPPRLR